MTAMTDPYATLAQQPACVDEAALQDIADAAAALDKRGDRQMATRMMRLHARLAAQQPAAGEVDDDGH